MKITRILLLTGLAALLTNAVPALTVEELEAQPEYWPIFVKTQDKLTDSGTGHFVRSGTRVVVVRVEDGKVLVDAGRAGVHYLDPEATNVLDNAKAIREGTRPKTAPLLVGHLSLRLCKPGTLGSFDPTVFGNLEHVLLYYHDPSDEASYALLEELEKLDSLDTHDKPHFSVIGISVDPSRNKSIAFIEKAGGSVTFPFVLPHLSYGYAKAFHHGATNTDDLPMAVLCDANGKIIANSHQMGGGENAIGEVVEQARAYAKAAAPSPQMAEKAAAPNENY